MAHVEVTPLTKISRDPHRGSYDKEVIYAILDEALDITVSYIADNIPRAIPTGFVRIDDQVYIHGSVKSHFIRQICLNAKVCLSVSLLDGIALANTAFNHSFNYRSVIAFAEPVLVHNTVQKMAILKAFTDKILPGRWEDTIRKPTPEELSVTEIVGFSLHEASAKMRTGAPNNVKNVEGPRVWTGHIPVKKLWQAPVASPDVQNNVEQPNYLGFLYKEIKDI